MFGNTFQELIKAEWAQLRARQALPCMVAIVISLFVGWLCGRPDAGMVAAGGAVTVGFGSFQWLGHSRVAPMLWATGGMAVSAVGGSLVGHHGWGGLFNAAWAGFGAGILLAIGPGASWIGQQCAIVALVASGYPTGWQAAVSRAGLILAGGGLQTLIMALIWRWQHAEDAPSDPDPYAGIIPALHTLWDSLTPKADAWHYAIRQSVTLTLATEVQRISAIPNGYWVPMTALLVLRPAFQPTFFRGIQRVVGTILGAGLASMLVRALRLDPLTTGFFTALFAWLAYAFTNVNYGVFAVFLTSYIVFLFDFGQISTTHDVVAHRTINTALGGGLALLSYVTVLLRRWWQSPDQRREAPARPLALDITPLPPSMTSAKS